MTEKDLKDITINLSDTYAAFKKSETYQNLLAAFAGECQARVKYEYYASKAKKDGFIQISDIFNETSRNEKEHAKIWFKLLYDGIQDTASNLMNGVEGEMYEHDIMYANFAKKAYEEGYDTIGDLFTQVGDIEEHHAQRYQKLFETLIAHETFKKSIPVKWKCNNCGHIAIGEEAPKICPVCNHPQDYFELLNENY